MEEVEAGHQMPSGLKAQLDSDDLNGLRLPKVQKEPQWLPGKVTLSDVVWEFEKVFGRREICYDQHASHHSVPF